MSILANLTAVESAPARTTNTNRPKAKTWLNVGYESNGKFVTLPLGMPLDTMEPSKISGQNEEWIKQMTAGNALLKALQELGDSLVPGAEQEINLVVKIRRVNEERTVKPEDNEFSIDFNTLIPKAAPVAAE